MRCISTMSVQCQYNVSTMSVQCQYYVSTMSVKCQYYVSTISVKCQWGKSNVYQYGVTRYWAKKWVQRVCLSWLYYSQIESVIIHQDITSHLCWEVSLVTLSTYFTWLTLEICTTSQLCTVTRKVCCPVSISRYLKIHSTRILISISLSVVI